MSDSVLEGGRDQDLDSGSWAFSPAPSVAPGLPAAEAPATSTGPVRRGALERHAPQQGLKDGPALAVVTSAAPSQSLRSVRLWQWGVGCGAVALVATIGFALARSGAARSGADSEAFPARDGTSRRVDPADQGRYEDTAAYESQPEPGDHRTAVRELADGVDVADQCVLIPARKAHP